LIVKKHTHTHTASYFLDLAFWVPKFNEDFYKEESTIGTFARYEPEIFFPDTISSKIIGRSVEFSKVDVCVRLYIIGGV
jgi:hypothetical protein